MRGILSRDREIISIGLVLFGLSLPLSKSINTILMVLLYLYLFFFLYRRRVSFTLKHPLFWPVLFFVVPFFVGIFISEDTVEALKGIKRISNLLFIYLLLANTIEMNNHRMAKKALFSLVIGLAILDMIGIAQYLTGARAGQLPIRPLGMHHIWFGNLNAVGLYVILSFFWWDRQGLSRLSLILLPLVLGAIVLSFSRTAWLGGILSLLVFFYIVLPKKRYYLIGVCLFVGIILGTYYLNNIVHERVNMAYIDIVKFFSGDPNTSIGSRLLMWKASLRMFLENPLFGVGTGDYMVVLTQYVKRGEMPEFILRFNHPHSIYMNALATNGLLGLTGMIYLFYRAIGMATALLKDRNPLGLLAFITTVHYLTAGLTEALFNVHILICLYAFVLGVCIRRKIKM